MLTNTTAPIVVLVDEVDAALELPFAADLLDAVGGCYERRSREPDFARLSFVLAGCTSQRALAEQCPDSVFADAEIIEPDDFDAEQAYRLAVAFGGDRELAQALMDRICAWTGGHPYLTQRVARGVARRGGRLEDVERAVREQLLAPGAADKDPLLGHVRAWLGEASRPARRATKLLHRLAAGAKVSQPADAAVWERLWLSGTVRVDAERKLGVRNRVVKELVAAGWLKQKAGAARWLAAAAVLLVVLAGGGYWYTQRLPVADIETLSGATTDIERRRASVSPPARFAGFRRARRRAVARSAAPTQRARQRRSSLRLLPTRACASCRVRTPRRIACSAISGCGARASRRTPSSATRRSCWRSAPRRCRLQSPPLPHTSPSSWATITRRSSGRCGSPARRSTGTWCSREVRSCRSTRSVKRCARRSVPRRTARRSPRRR